MQYLMVLLLSLGVFVLMVACVFGMSYAIGSILHSRYASYADPLNTDPCAQCHADRAWYEDLPLWKRNLVTTWWLVNRCCCAARGCG
jgi:hypothetical protein